MLFLGFEMALAFEWRPVIVIFPALLPQMEHRSSYSATRRKINNWKGVIGCNHRGNPEPAKGEKRVIPPQCLYASNRL